MGGKERGQGKRREGKESSEGKGKKEGKRREGKEMGRDRMAEKEGGNVR